MLSRLQAASRLYCWARAGSGGCAIPAKSSHAGDRGVRRHSSAHVRALSDGDGVRTRASRAERPLRQQVQAQTQPVASGTDRQPCQGGARIRKRLAHHQRERTGQDDDDAPSRSPRTVSNPAIYGLVID